MSFMDATGLWFSKNERNFSADYGKFQWTEEQRTWDWNRLTTVDLVMTKDGAKKLILRRKADIYSSQGRASESKESEINATLRYMLGIDINDSDIKGMETDYYTARVFDHNNKSWNLIGPKERLSFQIGENSWLWQWKDEGGKIEEIREQIKNKINQKELVYTNIFELDVDDNKQLKPVIYQPAVDAMKNFIREIHCSKIPAADGKNEVEVTIVFDNEELRRHKILNRIYEKVRLAKYGRLNDIESFIVMLNSDNDTAKGLRFKGIYSGNNDLEEDTIHGETEDNLPPHRVKYYANGYNHPIIFINTSNHAMAEHDTNPDIWKWEYVPWVREMPLDTKDISRKDVEKKYSNFLESVTKKLLGVLR